MSVRFLYVSLCGLVLYACSSQPADVVSQEASKLPLDIKANVDNARPHTGDDILYRVTVDRDERLNFELPEFGDQIAGLRIIDAGYNDPEKYMGRVKQTFWYKLRADIAQVYIIPPIGFKIPRPQWYTEQPSSDANSDTMTDGNTDDNNYLTISTGELYIEVGSRINDGQSMGLRDIKPLPAVSYNRYWIIILLSCVFIGLLVLLIVLRKKPVDMAEEMLAHERALLELQNLQAFPVTDKKSLRDFYYRLSAIIRLYIELRFDLNATDLTTQEIAQRITSISVIDEPHKKMILALLNSTDGIKYAGFHADQQRRQEDMKEVARFINDTRELTEDYDDED